jgi:hypothetical protein
LIKEVTVTEINKRKIDIKKAEPKTANSYQPIPGKPLMSGGPGMEGQAPATIPCYGQEGGQKQGGSRSPSREGHRGGGNQYHDRGDNYRGNQ